MVRLSHISSTFIFFPLFTLLPPHWPSYFLEHAKDFPTSGPLYLLFPHLRMHFPHIFLVLCFFIFLWSLLNSTPSEAFPNQCILTNVSWDHSISLFVFFFLALITPLHDIIFLHLFIFDQHVIPTEEKVCLSLSLHQSDPFSGKL